VFVCLFVCLITEVSPYSTVRIIRMVWDHFISLAFLLICIVTLKKSPWIRFFSTM